MLSRPQTVSGGPMRRCILRRASVLCAGGTPHTAGGEQMSDTYDLLPVGWDLAVPRRVRDALVDMGTACNDAALTLEGAYVEHRRAIHLADGAEACGEYAPHR